MKTNHTNEKREPDMTSHLCCPVCGSPLERQAHCLRCPKGHSYDIARQGYVHLLPVNRMNSQLPGDNPDMVRSRSRFLSGEYYRPLAEGLAETVAKTAPGQGLLLDAGCGEGYYTAVLRERLPKLSCVGIDISKEAVKLAARRNPEGEFAVASAFHLPLAPESCDAVLCVFAPLAGEEFLRVLRPGGRLYCAFPGKRHLLELKEVLYDRVRLNEENPHALAGFCWEESIPLAFSIHLPDRQAIQDLYAMTPYYYRTPKAGAARLAALESLDCRCEFEIAVFRKQ